MKINETKDVFKKMLSLDEEDATILMTKFSLKHLKKGDHFIEEGKKCDYIGFIIKGCIVCIYNKDGNEIIDEFSLDNEFISDYKNFLDEKKSEKNVTCIEDTDILVIKHNDLTELYKQKKSFERAGRIIAESLFKNWHNKAMSLMLDDAKTRYEKLIYNRQSLTQRVPQYLIASYLGITPQSLSRIRKNIN